MGYQDREYMRGEGSGGGEKGSNPLWWILGLIALILIVAFFRRGAMSGGSVESLRETVAAGGPMQTCRIELAAGPGQVAPLLAVLREFFHQQGYDSTIHETADATLTSASFMRHSENALWTQHAIYRYVGPGHSYLESGHTLVFQVHVGTGTQEPHLQQSLEVSQQLRVRLEADFPGIVARLDDTPRPVAYDEYE